MQSIFRIQNLAKSHPTGERPNLFMGVNATIGQQDKIAVIGASGQGKSTLLRIMARLEPWDSGDMFLQDRPTGDWQATSWRRSVCYVPQMPVMLPGTVADNLMTVSRLHRTPYDRALAMRLMEEVGLAHIDASKQAADLSGGEKQRLQLVRSLLLRPRIVLLDEATSSLDAASKLAVEQLLQAWNREEGAAFVWVTHDLEQAAQFGDRLWVMADGTLAERSGLGGDASCLP